MSTERSGLVSVGSGFIAPRTISGEPLVMPPSRPPARLRLAVVAALLGVEDLIVRLPSPGTPATVKPSPIETPLIAWIEQIAIARRPSRRSSQETCEPSPGTRPKACTSKTPPSDSLALRSRSISRTIARDASLSRQRTGELVDLGEVSRRQLLLPVRRVHGGDLHDVRVHAHTERAQEGLAQRPARHASGRLARRRALEDVAHVALLVLLRADEVGVAGARQVDLRDVLLDRPGVHPLLPVGVVAVGDLQRDRAAERASVADAGGDLGAVALDLHAPAAAVAELAARHVGVEVLGRQREARRQPLHEAGEARAVRLAGGDQSELHGS